MRSLWIISSSIVCSSLVVDAYASGFRDPMGHARLCGKFGVFFGAIGRGNLIRTYGIYHLMWIFWTKRNRRSFEATEKSLIQL